MNDFTNLKTLVQTQLNTFVAEKRESALAIGTELAPLFTQIELFLQGGKRLRATALALGWLAHKPLQVDTDNRSLRTVTLAACALELFHAAALVHDDIIDRSDSRRGKPAVHLAFRDLHRAQHLTGDASHFGVATAILIGDLLQSWADEMFDMALDITDDFEARHKARLQFNRMRTEVGYGQYFDTLSEQQAGFLPEAEQLENTTRIMLYKTAKYSVESPLLLGALLAGAGDTLCDALSQFAIPAGILFQLRDDVLGAFGDPTVTGKPAGDDIRQGKRTVLLTLARGKLPVNQQKMLDDILCDELSDEQIVLLQNTIKQTGALARVEEMISNNLNRAQQAARSLEISAEAVEPLIQLVEKIAHRTS